MIRSGGGVFDVKIDGRLVFSKEVTRSFPTDEELDALA